MLRDKVNYMIKIRFNSFVKINKFAKCNHFADFIELNIHFELFIKFIAKRNNEIIYAPMPHSKLWMREIFNF